jgi:hypothetical protein
MPAGIGEFEQGVVQLHGVAPGHRTQQPAQRRLLQGVKSPHRPEINQRQAAVAKQQDVAWVRVRMECPTEHHLAKHAVEQPTGERGAVRAESRVPVVRLRTIRPAHHDVERRPRWTLA